MHTIPSGYRAMTAEEGDRLNWGELVDLFDLHTGEIHHGTMHTATDDSVKIKLRSGAIIVLDIDDPAYWPDVEPDRVRHAPRSDDGQFIAVRPLIVGAEVHASSSVDGESALELQLRWSNAFAMIEARVRALEEQSNRIANFVQGLPQREEHDAVLADVSRLQEQVRGISLARVA